MYDDTKSEGAMRAFGILMIAAGLVGFVQPVRAWGADAHRIVAEQAERLLTPRASREVKRLLAVEPGATLGSIASWADQVRTLTDARWHYVNLPRLSGCRYEESWSCIDGHCVVAAIERHSSILGSLASDEEQLRALKFLVHLVADVHQPLHAGHAEDRGGNLHQLQAFGRGTNLHALWDSGLVANWPGGLSPLEMSVAADQIATVPATVARWAEESCQIVEEAWFYPAKHTADDHYVTQAQVVLVGRLRLAALRLADTLNQRLGAR